MKQKTKMKNVVASIILTVLSILLFIASSQILLVRNALTQRNIAKILEPFSIGTLVNENETGYYQVIADDINGAISRTMSGKGDYSSLVTAADVKNCINETEIRNFIAKKASEYGKAFFNSKKTISIDGQEMLALSTVTNLKDMVNEKIEGLNITPLTDEDVTDVLDGLLTDFNLINIVSADHAQKTRQDVVEALKDSHPMLSWNIGCSTVLGVIMVVAACVLMVVNILQRVLSNSNSLADAGVYGIITLAVPALYLIGEGFVVYGTIVGLVSGSITIGTLTLMPNLVHAFLVSCATVVKTAIFNHAVWFAVGIIPFIILEIWYVADAIHVNRLASGQRRNSSTPLVTFLLIGIIVILCVGIVALVSRCSADKQETVDTGTSSEAQFVYNGQVFIQPSYEGDCPLTVSTKGENGYLVYLKYVGEPENSTVERTSNGTGNGSDLAFYVSPGNTVDIDVPVGRYELYFASGPVWYGISEKFGEDTSYCKGDEILEFYAEDMADGGGMNMMGHTLELWLQADGNMESKDISAAEFPDCGDAE